MTPQTFIAKWQAGGSADALTERAGAQAHFHDLCELLGVDKPADPDNYCFERGAHRTGAGNGWADVWKRDHFAWEYKAPGADLEKALRQLMTYALALDNPPLLVVSDRHLIQIHTHFTGSPSEIHTIRIEDTGTPENLDKLRWLFQSPDRYRPERDNQQITEEAARTFAELAQSLRSRHTESVDSQRIAHFLTQCLFCLFAEDADLLPCGLFLRLLDKSQTDPAKLDSRLRELFAAMQKGGDFALEDISWFNGGLFETIDPLPFNDAEAHILLAAARLDWNAIDPAIFGTLFERGLDPKKRSQLGAHYTDPKTILRLVEPTIVRPLSAEWEAIRDRLAKLSASFGYLERLKNFRVLDPACGSGNFLYLALKALKDLEHKANLDAEALGLQRQVSIEVSPANVLGIELNEYAAELARVTVWIGELQWMRSHGYPVRKNPILDRLDHVENRDALINADGSEAEWPACDAIVGNPPFLGDKKMRSELGDVYTEALRKRYAHRVAGGADFVTYWFEKARAQIEASKCQHAGLVATQSIRRGESQKVLVRIFDTTRLFNVWSDEQWVNEGAAVRVSLACFGNVEEATLNGEPVSSIHPDLTAGGGINLTLARPLEENAGIAFIGTQKNGPFDIPGNTARQWLKHPNPNGRPNSDVVRPWVNGQDITARLSDTWIIDFGGNRNEQDSALYEAPFGYAELHVKPTREGNRDPRAGTLWWLHKRSNDDLRKALAPLKRFIATSRVAKHRLFVWIDGCVLPDSRLFAIAKEDDVAFGVLSSRVHVVWALANASIHGDGDEGGRPTYNAKSCFETFAFPSACSQNHCIGGAAKRLSDLREKWLNPPDWVDWVITPEEAKAGFPKRPVAKPRHEAELKKRTLTNLYNQRPTWLDNAHKALDAAVAAAYGWVDYTPEMPDEEILRRLLALNLERVAQQS